MVKKVSALKTFEITVSNRIRVEIKAKDAADAEERLQARIAKRYDYPYEESYDADGWEIENIEELNY